MRKFKVTASANSSALMVTPYVINKGQTGEYYGLKNAEDNQVLRSAPNNWKTRKGAVAWAKKNGYEVVESACGKKSVKASDTAKKYRIDIYKRDNPDALVKREFKMFDSEKEAKKYGESIANGNTVNVMEVKASYTKKSVKAARYSDAVPYENRKYWYFTTHGIGPGTLPKGVNILDTQEGQNRKGTWGDYILLDAVLNTDELREYDLVELAPLDKEPTIKPYKNRNTISVFDSCGKKSVKASSTKRTFTVKASANGYWADDINAENYRKILQALDDYLIANYDGKTIGDVEIGVSELRSVKNGIGSKIEIMFYCPDYNKDTKLEIITAPELRSKFLCRVSGEPFEFEDESLIRQSGSKQVVIDKINEIANKLSGSSVEGSCKTKKTVKASSAAKRRKAIKASATPQSDGKVLHQYYQVVDMSGNIEDVFDTLEEARKYANDLLMELDSRERKNTFFDIFYIEALYDEKGNKWGETLTDDLVEQVYTDTNGGVRGSKSIKCSSSDSYNDLDETMRFRVCNYYDTKFRDLAECKVFDDFDEAVDYAHECLGNGPTTIEDYYVGTVEINPDEYWDNFDGEFWCTPELAEWRDEVWKSMGIGASMSIKCSDADGYADEWEDIREVANQDSYEYDGFDDSDMLEYVDKFLQDKSSGAWLSTDHVVYNGPDDWEVSAGLSPEAVETDFWFFLDDVDHELYEDMLEEEMANPLDEDPINYTHNQNAINGNEFYIQLYPNNNQIYAPQIDFDEEYLTPEWLERLVEIRKQYEESRKAAYTEFQNGLGEFLANGITASTDITAGHSLNLNAKPNYTDWMLRGYKFNGEDVTTLRIDFQDDLKSAVAEMFSDPDIDSVDVYKIPTEQETTGVFEDEEFFDTFTRDYMVSNGYINASIKNLTKTRYKDNPIYELSDYVESIATGVKELLSDDIEVETSDEAITFTQNGEVIFVQSVDDITPEPDDLKDDIEDLASAVMSELDDFADYFEDSDIDDPDYATRAIQLSEDTDDELEPIMGEGDDWGFGFDSNGDPIDESTVEELERIAQDIVYKSAIADVDEYADLHNFNYYASIPYVQESFNIAFTYSPTGDELHKGGYVSEDGWVTTTATYDIHYNVRCENGEVKFVEITDIDADFIGDATLRNFQQRKLEAFARDLVAPVVEDIYNATTNI